MRNTNEDGRKFINRMEHEDSKKNTLFYFYLLIEYSNQNIREMINNETLSLRKKKQIQELISRRGVYICDRDRHQVCPLKLKGIPDQILEKYRIIPGDNDTIKKTMEYLNSKELNEIKFGAFLLRRFFSLMVEEDAKLNAISQKIVLLILL